MTDISTKRFNIKSNGFGGYTVRDNNAPYHPHTVAIDDLPSVHTMAMQTESQFDSAVAAAIYQ